MGLSAGYLVCHDITTESGSLAEHNLQEQHRAIVIVLQCGLLMEYIPN